MTAQLNREGHACSVGLVADVMREMELPPASPGPTRSPCSVPLSQLLRAWTCSTVTPAQRSARIYDIFRAGSRSEMMGHAIMSSSGAIARQLPATELLADRDLQREYLGVLDRR